MVSWSIEPFPYKNVLNHRPTSGATGEYNCIAWALQKNDQVVWPDPLELSGWPPSLPREESSASFQTFFEMCGFVVCQDVDLKPGLEKLAIYVLQKRVTHVARQLLNGNWTSKLGPAIDISHITPAVLEGPRYGNVMIFMQRPVPPVEPFTPKLYPEPARLINLAGGNLLG